VEGEELGIRPGELNTAGAMRLIASAASKKPLTIQIVHFTFRPPSDRPYAASALLRRQ
jgi:hypothetical protein